MITTYKDAYNAIIEAYFKDEMRPYHPNFCFCGTLCPNNQRVEISFFSLKNWNQPQETDYSKHFFTAVEYGRMERAMMLKLGATLSPVEDAYIGLYFSWTHSGDDSRTPVYEEKLFEGMSAALDEMKQIFIEKGLPVEDKVVEFRKRELV